MKKLFFVSLVCAASAFILIAFFMPWANVDTSVMGLTKSAEGTLAKTSFAGKMIKGLTKATDAISDLGDIEIKTTVRGNQIPAMVNNKTSKVALSLAQVFFKDAEGIDKKSYLVYLVPLLAIVCTLLGILGLKNNIFIFLMAGISGAISIGGLYNLMTMDIASMIVKISIAKGLWYTMYAYLAISLTGVVWLVLDRKK